MLKTIACVVVPFLLGIGSLGVASGGHGANEHRPDGAKSPALSAQSSCEGCKPTVSHDFTAGATPNYSIRVFDNGSSATGLCEFYYECLPALPCAVDVDVEIRNNDEGGSARSGLNCADAADWPGGVNAGTLFDLVVPCGSTDTSSQVSAEIYDVGCAWGGPVEYEVFVWPSCTPCSEKG